jgi:hypothetical protein
MEVATVPQKKSLAGVASLLCDVAAVVETRLLRHCLATCLGFQQIFYNVMIKDRPFYLQDNQV